MARATTSAESLEQYFTNRFETKLLSHMPPEDAELTAATRLLEKRRELAQADAEQSVHREQHEQHLDKLQQEKLALKQEEAKLMKSLEDYDTYLKENDIRRRRALKKLREETSACDEKNHEIQVLQERIAELQDHQEQQEQLLAEQEIFEKYLQSVIKETHDFNEIDELIDRHATLKVTNEELLAQEARNKDRMRELQAEGARDRENHKVVMLRLNNTLTNLEAKRDTVSTERLHWENQATLAEGSACKRTLLIGRIKMATANLYALVRARNRRGASQDRIVNPELQLDKIKIYLQDLTDICRMFDEEQQRESVE
eukprot:m.177516 g.177516  ORF g.177516 m.177516 type:complete len:315 (-) comp18371_c0_seq4:251-1195(-)